MVTLTVIKKGPNIFFFFRLKSGKCNESDKTVKKLLLFQGFSISFIRKICEIKRKITVSRGVIKQTLISLFRLESGKCVEKT